MLKKFMLTGFAAATVVLAGCGGGGGGSGSDPSGSGDNGSTSTVAVKGPLDPVQSALSTQVLSQLEDATAGTPLQGVLVCVDAGVNQNTLDIVDALLVGLQNPTTLQTTTAAQVQTQLAQLAANLQALLTALAGQSGCSTTTTGGGSLGGNPLAGTPLAPLGTALLPVLAQIQSAAGGSTGGSGGATGLTSVANLISALNTAFKNGLAGIPAQARTAPVLGGVFTTISTSLDDVSKLLTAVDANDTAGFTTDFQNTLDHLLVNVLTQVVPASTIETQAGQPGLFTGPVDQAAAQFSQQAAAALAQGTTQLINLLNSQQLATVLNPVDQLVGSIINPITQALAGAGSGSGSTTGPTGTPLDAVLAPLTSLLGSLAAGGGGGSGSSSCPLASVPLLSALCTLVP